MYDAFISYSRADANRVKRIHNFLQRARTIAGRKIALSVFLDKTDMRGGRLSDEIKLAIESSRFLIVCCSPHSKKSSWVQEEVSLFLSLNDVSKVIILILSGDSPNVLPTPLADKQLHELNLKTSYLASWLPLFYSEELARVLAKIADMPLRALIDWNQRRKLKTFSVFLGSTAAAVAAALGFTIYIINIAPEHGWVRSTELDKVGQPITSIELIEEDSPRPIIRAFTWRAIRSFNDSLYEERGQFSNQLLDIDFSGNLLGEYHYVWFVEEHETLDRRIDVSRDYMIMKADGSALMRDIKKAKEISKVETPTVVHIRSLRNYRTFELCLSEAQSRKPCSWDKVLPSASSFLSLQSRYLELKLKPVTTSVLTRDTVVIVTFGSKLERDKFDSGHIAAVSDNFATLSSNNGAAWVNLGLPSSISAKSYRVEYVIPARGQSDAVVAVYFPLDAGKTQSFAPKIFLKRRASDDWLTIDAAHFDSRRFEVVEVTRNQEILVLADEKLQIWKRFSRFERFVRGIDRLLLRKRSG